MKPVFSLAIPTTPWIPERVTSFDRLLVSLSTSDENLATSKVFADKEPNWSWSKKMWEWGAQQAATHLCQVQDDVIPAPNFWPALTAMVGANPNQIICLQGAHPFFRELARAEHKWARSNAWFVGVAYVIPCHILEELVLFRIEHKEKAEKTNEDEFIAFFALMTQRSIWHPIPTLIDHDTTIASTYANDGHAYRKPTVTWKEFGAREIEDPAFWVPRLDVPVVQSPHYERCMSCHGEPMAIRFDPSGIIMGARCMSNGIQSILTRGQKPNE